MLNFKNESNKSFLKSTSFSLLLLLAWCWWEQSWETQSTPTIWVGSANSTIGNATDTGNATNTEFIKAKVQAGIVVWSMVELFTIDWILIYSAVTDENWEYEINIKDFKEALNSNWLNNNSPITVKASFWTDIDPDDDWDINNDVDIIINWHMRSVLSFNQLSNSITNPITTKISNILLWINNEKITDFIKSDWSIDIELFNQRIIEILENLGVKDINNDSKLSLEDIINYDMVLYDSLLEKVIRLDGTLDIIHSWNTTKLETSLIPYSVPKPTFTSFGLDDWSEYSWNLTAEHHPNTTLVFAIDTNPTVWELTLNEDGSFLFSANTWSAWNYSFKYSVFDWNKTVYQNVEITINMVEVVNTPPEPQDNDFSLDQGSSYSLNLSVLDNENDNLKFTKINDPEHFSKLQFGSDWSVSYTPKSDYYWTDSFTYTVTDWEFNVEQTVNIKVIKLDVENTAPLFQDNDFKTDEDTTYTWQLLAEDNNPSSLSYILNKVATNWTFTLNQDGSYTYKPNDNFYWNDSVEVTVNDWEFTDEQTINISVESVNDNPIATFSSFELKQDSYYSWELSATDIEKDIISFDITVNPEHWEITNFNKENWVFIYTPNQWYSWDDTFTFIAIDDRWWQSEQIVTITINELNYWEAPTIGNNIYYFDNIGTSFDWKINATDPENNTLSYIFLNNFSNWTTSLDNNTWNYSYTPTSWFYWISTVSFEVSDWKNTSSWQIVLNVEQHDPYMQIRSTQEWSKYYRKHKDLILEWYTCNVTSNITESCYLNWILADWTSYKTHEYIFMNWFLENFTKYIEIVDADWNSTIEIDLTIDFQQEWLLIDDIEYYKNWIEDRRYAYNDDWVLLRYEKYNENHDEIIIIKYENWIISRKYDYEYHTNWEVLTQSLIYFTNDWTIDRKKISTFDNSWVKDEKITYYFSDNGFIVIEKRVANYKNWEDYKEFVYEYDEVTWKKTIKKYYKYDKLENWYEFDYHENWEYDDIMHFSINDDWDISFAYKKYFDEDWNKYKYRDYYYYDWWYDENDGLWHNLKKQRKYEYFPGTLDLEEVNIYDYYENDIDKQREQKEYNTDWKLTYHAITKYDEKWDKISKIIYIDDENWIDDQNIPNEPDNTIDTSNWNANNYTIRINTITWLVQYINSKWKIEFSQIEPKYIVEGKEVDSTIEIIWDDLPTEYEWYNNRWEYVYDKLNNPTWTQFEGYKDGVYQALSNRGEDIVNTSKSIWNTIEWTWEYIWERLSSIVFNLDEDQQTELWWDVKSLSDIPQAINEWIEQSKEIITSIKTFIKDELAFYYEHKTEIINRLIRNSWKSEQYWEWFIEWYITEMKTYSVFITAVSWYVKKPQVAIKSIESQFANFIMLTKHGKVDIDKIKNQLKNYDEEMLYVFQEVEKKNWDMEKKFKFYDRLNKSDWDTIDLVLIDTKNQVNNFEKWWTYWPVILNEFNKGRKWSLELTNWKFSFKGSDGNNLFPKDWSNFINYVLIDWKLYFWHKHLIISWWKNVDYAGSINFNDDLTKITNYNNSSWHYEPNLLDFEWIKKVDKAFKDQFGIDLWNYPFEPYDVISGEWKIINP